MPAPNPNNPLCPFCNQPTSFNCNLASGAKQYRCRRGCKNEKGKTVTLTDSDRPVGCPPIGEVAMTKTEIDQRYRDANREKYRAAQKVRRDNKRSKNNAK